MKDFGHLRSMKDLIRVSLVVLDRGAYTGRRTSDNDGAAAPSQVSDSDTWCIRLCHAGETLFR
jgi:hypothetical protein